MAKGQLSTCTVFIKLLMDAAALVAGYRKIKSDQICWSPGWVPDAVTPALGAVTVRETLQQPSCTVRFSRELVIKWLCFHQDGAGHWPCYTKPLASGSLKASDARLFIYSVHSQVSKLMGNSQQINQNQSTQPLLQFINLANYLVWKMCFVYIHTHTL